MYSSPVWRALVAGYVNSEQVICLRALADESRRQRCGNDAGFEQWYSYRCFHVLPFLSFLTVITNTNLVGCCCLIIFPVSLTLEQTFENESARPLTGLW